MTTLPPIDPTVYLSLAFLFGIAAQFTVMGGHDFLRRIVAVFENRVGILFAVVVVAGVFSPFILNDVVIIVLTPVMIRYAKQFKIDAAPLLVAEITTVNIASSLSPIGNPQNILLWSSSNATFGEFLAGAWFPVLLSFVLAVLALLPLALRLGGRREFPTSLETLRPPAYLVLVATVAVVSDLAGMEPYVSLGLGFFVGFLFTFRSVKQIPKEFDIRSLLVLFVFVGSVTVGSDLLASSLAPYVQPVAEGVQPYSALFIGAVSNVISNVPATQLIVSNAHVTALIAPKIAVEAGLAGNITPVGSFANLLALQMARRAGLPIRRTIAIQFVVGGLTFLPAFL